jgi:predicted enzyme related to lactoylglutathione lyase
MLKHVAFFVYPVTNMQRSRQFYEETLGLKLEQETDAHWLEYKIQDVRLVLTDWPDTGRPGCTGGALALEVAHADSLFHFFRDNQVAIIQDLFETPVGYLGMIADPDGNGILIHQAKAVKPELHSQFLDA